jgi:phage terminase large subunit-like protein
MSSQTTRPYIDENGLTDAEKYLVGCLDGTYVVGRHLKQLAEMMLPQIRDGYREWHWDPDRATKPVRFIEKFCRIPSAEKMGQPFVLEPYERMIVELAFGFVDDEGYRRFREVIVEVGRKNGKTSLLAALNLYMLTSDGEPAAECYNGATSTNQASLCYGSTQDMKEMSPVLDRNIRYGKIKKRKQMGLNYDKTRSYLCTISGRHKSLDGLNVHFGVLDELAAFTDNGAAYRLLKGSMGSRRQPMLFIISTSNYVRFNIWDKRLNYSKRMLSGEVDDPRLLPILYELDDETEVYDEAMWPKANPGLGTVKSWATLRHDVEVAKQDPSELPELLSKQFNLPANQEAAFFTYDEACNPAKYEYDSDLFKYCVVGIDAADSIDLNCATALFMKKDDPHIYRRSMYWIAEEQVKINIASNGRDHGAPYLEWADAGYIRIVPGNKVDRRVFLEWIQELYEDGLYCRAVAHDRYGMKEIEDQLNNMVGKSNVHALAYGPKTLTDPMKRLRADMRDGMIVDNDNPIDHWCNLNVAVIRDTGGGIKPIKKDGPGDRIDGFSALIMAYTVLQEQMEDYQVLVSG